MLILQCIAYGKGEGLTRFGNVYYCGGEILGVFTWLLGLCHFCTEQNEGDRSIEDLAL